MVYEHQSGEEA